MGRPRRLTTARGMAASGTRRARLPVFAVTRRGSREPALTTMVRGPGQKFFGETVEGGVDLAGEFVGLGDLGDEEREGFVTSTGFELVDAVDGAEIDGVDGETVEGVGGEGDDVAVVEAGDDVPDERGFGLVRDECGEFRPSITDSSSGRGAPLTYLGKVFNRCGLGPDLKAGAGHFDAKYSRQAS